MKLEKVANQIHKTYSVIGPICFILYLALVYTKNKTSLTSFFVLVFTLLMLSEGILSLKFSKPSYKRGIEKLWACNLPEEVKIKKEKVIQTWNKIFIACELVGPFGLLLFWFLKV